MHEKSCKKSKPFPSHKSLGDPKAPQSNPFKLWFRTKKGVNSTKPRVAGVYQPTKTNPGVQLRTHSSASLQLTGTTRDASAQGGSQALRTGEGWGYLRTITESTRVSSVWKFCFVFHYNGTEEKTIRCWLLRGGITGTAIQRAKHISDKSALIFVLYECRSEYKPYPSSTTL